MFRTEIKALGNSAQSRFHLSKTNTPGYQVYSMLVAFTKEQGAKIKPA